MDPSFSLPATGLGSRKKPLQNRPEESRESVGSLLSFSLHLLMDSEGNTVCPPAMRHCRGQEGTDGDEGTDLFFRFAQEWSIVCPQTERRKEVS